jgi:hypothetical protein
LSFTTLLLGYRHRAITKTHPAHPFIFWPDNDRLIRIIAGAWRTGCTQARKDIELHPVGDLIERKPSQVGSVNKLPSGYQRGCFLLRPHSFLFCGFVQKAGQIAQNSQNHCRFKPHFSLLPLRYQTKPADLNFLSKIRLEIVVAARFWSMKHVSPLGLQGSVTSLYPPSSSLSISIKYIIMAEAS